MDPIGVFIATLHQTIGHDKAAAFIGVPAGDKAACLLCQYEKAPGREQAPGQPKRVAVEQAIGRGAPT